MDSDSDFLDEFDDGEAQQAIVLLAAENLLPNHGGSRPGRAPNVDRGIQQGHERIIKDYFAPEPVYGEKVFRRRFRMHRLLFLRIVEAVEAYDAYFQQKPDATPKETSGFHPSRNVPQPSASWHMECR